MTKAAELIAPNASSFARRDDPGSLMLSITSIMAYEYHRSILDAAAANPVFAADCDKALNGATSATVDQRQNQLVDIAAIAHFIAIKVAAAGALLL